MTLLSEAHDVVGQYSTTWYDPVRAMPSGLNEAVTCAYLVMRGIDEIEDHPSLGADAKVSLLTGFSARLQRGPRPGDFAKLWVDAEAELPEVTLRLDDWVDLAPADIRPRVWETFATMAERMARWAGAGFTITTADDLDQYTYAVSSTLVLMLSDLWAWHDGTRTDRTAAVGYGRALQVVNILVDRDEDTGRGVDFWPDGWSTPDMAAHAAKQLVLADAYLADLPEGPARRFCAEPLARAHRAAASIG